jgi:hypothetical protein
MSVCTQAATRQKCLWAVDAPCEVLQHLVDISVIRLRCGTCISTGLCTPSTCMSLSSALCLHHREPSSSESECRACLHFDCDSFFVHFLSFTISLLNDERTHKFIDETETRPALYNKNLKEYSDVNLKRRLWLEVCETVFEDWNNKTGQQKSVPGKFLNKLFTDKFPIRNKFTMQIPSNLP